MKVFVTDGHFLFFFNISRLGFLVGRVAVVSRTAMLQPVQNLDEVLNSANEASVGPVVKGRVFEAAVGRMSKVDDSDVDEFIRRFDGRRELRRTVVGDQQRACVEPLGKREGSWAVVVAKSLLTPEIRGSNSVIGKILSTNLSTNCIIEKTNIKKKRPGMAHL